jgi:hypothetical protein
LGGGQPVRLLLIEDNERFAALVFTGLGILTIAGLGG